MAKEILTEFAWIAIMGFILFFASTNVNPTLGTIYTGLLILGGVMLIADIGFGKKNLYFSNPSIPLATAMIIALFSYVVLVISSYFMSSLSKVIPLTQILTLLGSTAPVFSNSVTLNFLIFSIVIPFIETYVIFFLSIDLFSTVFKIPLEKRNLLSFRLILLIMVITVAFLLFHTNAKGIENESALLLVGIMALISCVLIVMFKEARIAILFHVLANAIASIAIFSGAG
jgi:hypothetical protein